MATLTVSWSGGGDGTIIDVDNDARVAGGEGTHWFTNIADGWHKVRGRYGNSEQVKDVQVVDNTDQSVWLSL